MAQDESIASVLDGLTATTVAVLALDRVVWLVAAVVVLVRVDPFLHNSLYDVQVIRPKRFGSSSYKF